MSKSERNPLEQRAIHVSAPVRQIDSKEHAARGLVPDRRALALQVRNARQAAHARRVDLRRLGLERLPRDAGRARASEPLEGGAAQRAAQRQPSIAADVMAVDEPRVEARLLQRHEEVTRRAEHQARLTLVDDARAERARREVAAAGDDGGALPQAGGQRGFSRDGADHVLGAPDGGQDPQRDAGRLRPALGPRSRARVEQRRAEHRRRQIAGGLSGQAEDDVRVRLHHERDALEELRLVGPHPGELGPEVIRVQAVAADGLGVGPEGRLDGARLGGGAHVEPQDGRPQRPPRSVDDDRGRRLSGHADGVDAIERDGPGQPRARGAHRAPPARRIGLRAPGGGGLVGARDERRAEHAPGRVDGGGANTRRADVDAEQRRGGHVSPSARA